jgi:hypothetical protein
MDTIIENQAQISLGIMELGKGQVYMTEKLDKVLKGQDKENWDKFLSDNELIASKLF